MFLAPLLHAGLFHRRFGSLRVLLFLAVPSTILLEAGSTPPAWESQPRVPLWPRGPLFLFNPHILFSCCLRSWHSSSFSCSIFQITTAFFSTLTLIRISHRILVWSFFNNFGGCAQLWPQHFLSRLGTDVPVDYCSYKLWWSIWASPVSIFYYAIMCYIVSVTSVHNLHLGSCLLW